MVAPFFGSTSHCGEGNAFRLPPPASRFPLPAFRSSATRARQKPALRDWRCLEEVEQQTTYLLLPGLGWMGTIAFDVGGCPHQSVGATSVTARPQVRSPADPRCDGLIIQIAGAQILYDALHHQVDLGLRHPLDRES